MPSRPHICDRIDSCLLPDDNEKLHPPTQPPSRRDSIALGPHAEANGSGAQLNVPEDGLATAVESGRSSRTAHDRDADTEQSRDATDLELGVTAEGDLKRRKTEKNQSDVAAEHRDWADNVVMFDSKTDPANPKNWPFRRKVAITLLFGITTMCSTFASSVFSPASLYVARQYGISSEISVLGVAIFIAGYVPGPVIWAPLRYTIHLFFPGFAADGLQ